jgi:hypothetical protein
MASPRRVSDPQDVRWLVLFAIACTPPRAPEVREERLAAIAMANANGVLAHHVLLARRTGKGDARCYAGPEDAELEALVAHHTGLLASNREALRAWAHGGSSTFEPARDLAPLANARLAHDPRLPYEAARARYARLLGDSARARAVASLYETILEVERDTTVLPSEMDLYTAVGLPIYDAALGLPASDADLRAAGEELARATCASPFDVDAAAWQLAGRKLASFAEKRLHVRDGDVVARELAAEPDVRALLPALAALPPRRVAVLGHSFTMAEHWSSPSSFTDIAARVVASVNPRVEVRHFTDGGLGAARARAEKFPELVAWRPDEVLFVLLFRKDEDFAAFEAMLEALPAGTHAHLFDNVRAPNDRVREWPARVRAIAERHGAAVIEASEAIARAPERARFDALDGIHMTEAYHRFMAKRWLAWLAAARPPHE